MASPTKKLGVTPPISEHFPTQAELESNSAMVDELRSQGIFESSKETEKRFVNDCGWIQGTEKERQAN
jgi:poly(A) polymerase Pap1